MNSEGLKLEDIERIIKKSLKTTGNNLKGELTNVKEEIMGHVNSEVKKLREENEAMKRKIEKMDSRENRRNIIFRGIPEEESSKSDEIGNLARIFEGPGCDSINIEEAVVFAIRLGKTQGNRLLKVECNTIKDRIKICGWREELRGIKITISKDYSFEEREAYAAFKNIQDILKRKFAIKSKIVGKKMEIFQAWYNLKEAQDYANDLLKKEGLETMSSPEMIIKGKRIKTVQKQKGEDKKKRNLRGRRRQESPSNEMEVGDNSSSPQ